MKKLAYPALVLALVLAAFTGGALWSGRSAVPAEQGQKILHYTCPMHPQYKQDHAGDCPSCGMRLEPVYEGGSVAPLSGDRPMTAGTVRVSAEGQQAIGVHLGVVARLSGTHTLRTTGRVAPNENAVYPLVAGSDGWVRDVRGATTGSLVRKNEVLATFYSPEIVIAQQSWYSGLDTLGRVSDEQLQAFNDSRVKESVDRQANTLRNLGVSELQLREMQAKRELTQNILVLSPVDGFVLERKASAGVRFDRGFEFFRIADLRQVWILADVYENQLPFIRQGSKTRITSHDQNRGFQAMVSRTEPIFDDATRTLKVRLETDNPGFTLKPGMFVDVEFAVELPPSLVVPADAIVDTGTRKTVFVDRGKGYFEPRQIEAGWRIGGQVEVIKGLMAGEKIVISGTFLIDSESRMKAAAAGIYTSAAKDPVCGMDVDEKKAAAIGRTAEHDGHTYYFCSDECKRSFQENPGRYVDHSHGDPAAGPPAPGPMPSRSTKPGTMKTAAPATDTARDPVCGMDVDPKAAKAAGRTSEHGGTTYYFCADDCKKQFDAEPTKYVK